MTTNQRILEGWQLPENWSNKYFKQLLQNLYQETKNEIEEMYATTDIDYPALISAGYGTLKSGDDIRKSASLVYGYPPMINLADVFDMDGVIKEVELKNSVQMKYREQALAKLRRAFDFAMNDMLARQHMQIPKVKEMKQNENHY